MATSRATIPTYVTPVMTTPRSFSRLMQVRLGSTHIGGKTREAHPEARRSQCREPLYRVGRNSHTGEVLAYVEWTWEGLR